MFRTFAVSLPAIVLVAGFATAQPRPVTVITPRPPVIVAPPNFVSPFSQTPVLNAFPRIDRPIVLPATYTPPVILPTQITPWGVQPAQMIPWSYTPPQVATVERTNYTPVSNWTAIDFRTGNVYDAWNDTFTKPEGTYRYNPWTGSYTNPWTDGRYNPRTGITIRPLTGR